MSANNGVWWLNYVGISSDNEVVNFVRFFKIFFNFIECRLPKTLSLAFLNQHVQWLPLSLDLLKFTIPHSSLCGVFGKVSLINTPLNFGILRRWAYSSTSKLLSGLLGIFSLYTSIVNCVMKFKLIQQQYKGFSWAANVYKIFRGMGMGGGR